MRLIPGNQHVAISLASSTEKSESDSRPLCNKLHSCTKSKGGFLFFCCPYFLFLPFSLLIINLLSLHLSGHFSNTEVKCCRSDIIVHPQWSRGYNFSQTLASLLQASAQSRENLALEMDEEFFKGKLRNGFFVEAGAFDGEWKLLERLS